MTVCGSLCIALTSVALLPSPAEPLGEILQSVPHFPPVGEHQSLLSGLQPPGTTALQATWGIVSIRHGSASQPCAAKATGHPSAKHSPQRLLGPPPIPSCLPGSPFFSQIAAGGFGPPLSLPPGFQQPCLEPEDAWGEMSPGEGDICPAVEPTISSIGK